MQDWHDFFLAQAGAAGVLTGLVFVGVSINLDKIVADPSSGLAGRAAEALILLVAVLIASVAARPRTEHDADRGRDPPGGARRLGMDRGHPIAAAQELGHHGTRFAQAFHTTRGGGTGRHAAVRGRGYLRAGRGSGRPLLAGGRYHLLDPRSAVRRVGAARGDQPVAEVREARAVREQL